MITQIILLIFGALVVYLAYATMALPTPVM